MTEFEKTSLHYLSQIDATMKLLLQEIKRLNQSLPVAPPAPPKVSYRI